MDKDAHGVAACGAGLAHVVARVHEEGGQFGARGVAQAVAERARVGRVGGGGEEAHAGEGVVEGGVGRREEELVGLAGLEEGQQLVVVGGVKGVEGGDLFEERVLRVEEQLEVVVLVEGLRVVAECFEIRWWLFEYDRVFGGCD